MILLAYRHGLRSSELVELRWEQVDFKSASLAVRRLKNGTPSTHPLTGRELRELRRHQRESPQSPFVFVSERGAPLSRVGFARMVERAAAAADLKIKAHAHMLRHACGFKLAKAGVDTRARTSGTAIFSTPCVTPSWRPIGSRGSGGTSSEWGLPMIDKASCF
jgi:integrase